MQALLFMASIIIFIWSIILQKQLQSLFKKYSQIQVSSGITGAEIATEILQKHQINEVQISPIEGNLTDHYNPAKKTVGLSIPVYQNTSIASVAIAAHEIGHVLQYYEHSILMRFRALFLPAANLGSNTAIPLFFIGLLFSSPFLMQIGVFLFLGIFLFHLVTLPIEVDASRRAIKILTNDGYLSSHEEITGAKKILRYAAFTYLASLLMSLVQLLRMFLASRRD